MSEIVLREVGTRDGIQSLGAFIDTPRKVQLLEALSGTGIRRIEATSFVNAKAVPQMADAAEVMARVRRQPGVQYEALVPNVRGAENAVAARMDAILVVLMASEAFNLKNVRMSVEDSLRQAAEIKKVVDGAGVACTGAIGTAFGCPYEGDIPESRVFDLIDRYVALGFTEIMLADTTGMANPLQIERMCAQVLERWSAIQFGLHLHNTRGMGLANVVAGARAGIRLFDASIAGIGGCPFAPQAAGKYLDRGYGAHAPRDGLLDGHRSGPAHCLGATGAGNPRPRAARPGHEGRPALAAARRVKAITV
jgi:hydroxymethylglutaryl-CoA lyase